MHSENVVKTVGFLCVFKMLLFPAKQFDEIKMKLQNASTLQNITRSVIFLFGWLVWGFFVGDGVLSCVFVGLVCFAFSL